jgi:hypothetical protein
LSFGHLVAVERPQRAGGQERFVELRGKVGPQRTLAVGVDADAVAL